MTNRFADAQTISSVIYQAVGAASVCWETPPTGVFESERAKAIGDDALERINQLLATLTTPTPTEDFCVCECHDEKPWRRSCCVGGSHAPLHLAEES